MDRALNRNIRTIYWMTFFQSAMIITAVFVPLMQRHGLSMSQVLQTQSLFALVVAASEVPSGYLADLWGRKRAIILGQCLNLVAFVILLNANSFVDFMFYEALMGIGISLCSGADLALLYDSRAALASQDETTDTASGNPISRLVAIESYSAALAGILAGVLTMFSLDWVLWAQLLVSALAMACALGLVEAPRGLTVGSHKDNVFAVVDAIVKRPPVMFVSLAIVVFGVSALLGFWLLQKYWEEQGVPLTLFGYIWAIHCIVRGLAANNAHAIEAWLGWRKLLVICIFLPVIAFTGMAIFGGWVGVLFGFAMPISRGLNVVIFYDALNRRVSGSFRATINSVVSLCMRGAFIVAGPLLGYLVDLKGVDFSLYALAAVSLPIFCVVVVFLTASVSKEENAADNASAQTKQA